MSDVAGRLRLGDLLVESHVATRDSVEAAASTGRATGRRLGEVLVENGLLGEEDLYRALARLFGLAFSTGHELIAGGDPSLAAKVPRVFFEYQRVLPIRRDGDAIVVAIADPTTQVPELASVLDARVIEYRLVTPTDLRRIATAFALGQVGPEMVGIAEQEARGVDLLVRHRARRRARRAVRRDPARRDRRARERHPPRDLRRARAGAAARRRRPPRHRAFSPDPRAAARRDQRAQGERATSTSPSAERLRAAGSACAPAATGSTCACRHSRRCTASTRSCACCRRTPSCSRSRISGCRRACPRPTGACSTVRAASCSSSARPARASRPRCTRACRCSPAIRRAR